VSTWVFLMDIAFPLCHANAMNGQRYISERPDHERTLAARYSSFVSLDPKYLTYVDDLL